MHLYGKKTNEKYLIHEPDQKQFGRSKHSSLFVCVASYRNSDLNLLDFSNENYENLKKVLNVGISQPLTDDTILN